MALCQSGTGVSNPCWIKLGGRPQMPTAGKSRLVSYRGTVLDLPLKPARVLKGHSFGRAADADKSFERARFSRAAKADKSFERARVYSCR